MQQSSLFKFVSRENSRKQRPSESYGADPSSQAKRPKTQGTSSEVRSQERNRNRSKPNLKKLKKFAREGTTDNDRVNPCVSLAHAAGYSGTGEQSSVPSSSHKSNSIPHMLSHTTSNPQSHTSSKSCAEVVCGNGKSGCGSKKTYTPLEQQFLAIKAKHPDTILLVECGYRYRFFGEDAEVAAKELKIGCFPDHNFLSSSIPVHRLYVHVRRLVAAGHKVGVVKQTETAALKAMSDKKSGPFTRQLTGLYTRATLLGPDVERGSHENEVLSPRGRGEEEEPGGVPVRVSVAMGGEEEEEEGGGLYLMCLCEGKGMPVGMVGEKGGGGGGGKGRTSCVIGFLAVQPSTGNMVYEEFADTAPFFSELDTRLSHLHPVELLFPQSISKSLERSLEDWRRSSGVRGLRLERIPDAWFEYNSSFRTVTEFYSQDNPSPTSAASSCADGSTKSQTAEALQAAINLPASCLLCLSALTHHLEPFGLQRVLRLFQNLQPFSTSTHCMRLSGRCLENLELFRNQTDRTERGTLFWVLNHTRTPFGRRMLRKWISYPLRDIRKIEERQEAVSELARKLGSPCVSLLKEGLRGLPDLEKMLCSAYHKKCSPSEFVTMVKVLVKLHSDLQSYSEMAQEEMSAELLLSAFRNYMVEVQNKFLHMVPSDWTRMSSTKAVSRFHPPLVQEAVRLMAQHGDQLRIKAKEAWDEFLDDFSENYHSCKKAVGWLATLDCLLSLSKVSKLPGYVCPKLVNDPVVSIAGGRHPVLDQLLSDGEQYVPNNTHMSGTGLRVMLVTGPNMGGKSCFIKQVALVCIMAQLGSFVPAESATLGPLDAVYTRIGAQDSIHTGKSTFMVELMEAAEIIRMSTPRSLVILDELGRGTSTHDGTAVAYATLKYLIEEVKPLTLFVTHYPPLAELEDQYPATVANYHMAYVEVEGEEYERVVFLYQLEKGKAGKSYGLNVAALAGLRGEVLQVAAKKSMELQNGAVSVRSQGHREAELLSEAMELESGRSHNENSSSSTATCEMFVKILDLLSPSGNSTSSTDIKHLLSQILSC